MTVDGEIRLCGEVPAAAGATLHIRVEDVSRADAPARVLASEEISPITLYPAASQSLSFSLTFDVPPAPVRLNLRAHLDLDADGLVSSGDFLSRQSYPLDPNAVYIALQIEAHRIT